MTSKTIYDKCRELLEKNFKKGDEVGREPLATKIMLEIGGQDRTIENSLKVMMATKLIKDIGQCHFKIL